MPSAKMLGHYGSTSRIVTRANPAQRLRPIARFRYAHWYMRRLSTPAVVVYSIPGQHNISEGLLSRESDASHDEATRSNAASQLDVTREVAQLVTCGAVQQIPRDSVGSAMAIASQLRTVPEGMLSREEDSSPCTAFAGCDRIPRDMPLHTDSNDHSSDAAVDTIAGTSSPRTVPLGLPSRARNSTTSSSYIAAQDVPEGMLSREEDGDTAAPQGPSFSAHVGSAAVPPLLDCVLLREEEEDGPWDGPYPPGLRVLPEGMLSRDDDVQGGDGSVAGPLRRPIVAAAIVVAAPPATDVGEAAADAPAPQPEPATQLAKFNWSQQWYAVAPLVCLDPSRPHPFTLLGQDLVLWRDGSGRWRAFLDACPHRLAPLSEGRVEADGTLLCAYHGWRFDGSGACTAIPTCRGEAQEKRATGSPRSCAVQYPTLERGGLLWVWGEGGPEAAARSAARSPALPAEVQEDGASQSGVTGRGWTFRDLPYGHVYFIENVVDPAHVPVSHHKVAGDRYKDTKPFEMELTRPPTIDGFEVRINDAWKADVRDSSTAFYPPGHVRIQQNHHNGSKTVLALYSTPTVPGWTRHIGQQFLVEAPGGGARGSGLGFFAAPLPDWLLHTLAALFLHQDMVFLHHQERTVERQQRAAAAAAGAQANTDASSSPLPPPKYYMPTTVDRGVTAWRSWLATYAGGDVTFAPGTPPLGPRERDPAKLFDTWNTHTRQCAICMRALARLRAARLAATVLGVAAAALAVATAAARAAAAAAAATAATAAAGAVAPAAALPMLAAAGMGFLSWEVAALGFVALAAGAVCWATQKIESLMHTYEYSHADNH